MALNSGPFGVPTRSGQIPDTFGTTLRARHVRGRVAVERLGESRPAAVRRAARGELRDERAGGRAVEERSHAANLAQGVDRRQALARRPRRSLFTAGTTEPVS